jgi:beta-barrel assembly-enhancing protease
MRNVFALLLLTASTAPAAPKADQTAAYRALAAQDLRVANIGYRLASANAPFCTTKARNPGWVLHSYRQYPDRDVARQAFPFPTPLAISAIVPGGPADVAGLKAGFGLSNYPSPGGMWWGGELKVHKPSYELVDTVNRKISELFERGQPLTLPFQTSAEAPAKPFTINPPAICASDFWVDARTNKDAGADGEKVRITSGLIDYVANDDELAAIAAHELAHNLLGHPAKLASIRKKKTSATRATEIEADQLSVWLMSNAGYDPQTAIRFWQRYGPTKAQGIFAARTHLPWRQRIATLQNEIALIEKASISNGRRQPPLLAISSPED